MSGQGSCERPVFIADHMLGKLARWLRIVGYDTVFSPRFSDADIARVALREKRIVLTRDRGLVARAAVTRCIFIRSQEHGDQLRQVFEVLNLTPDAGRIFSICPVCNRSVTAVEKESVRGAVPEYVFETKENFSKCPECGRVFWRGTHHQRTIAKFMKIFRKG
ncbi:MAG: Mut7-C RNAse domain-containing protein [Candidatus Aureabacteria bacterium]|nr:Mut7-C RNAse domain-containing protein [Candidatus Auribacterota bacterium]